MANLQKVLKLTQQQYNILAGGGTVGSYTGLNANYIYLVEDSNEYVTTDTAQTITAVKTFDVNPKLNGIADNGGTNRLIISSSGIIYSNANYKPYYGNYYDLGDSSYTWKDLYLSGTAYTNNVQSNGTYLALQGVDGALTLGGQQAQFNVPVVPTGTTQTLGASARPWKDLYLSGNLSDGTNSISVANIASKGEIPTVNNGTLTIQKNGTNVQTFTANQSSNVTANITVPTKTSDITNDSGFITSHQSIKTLKTDNSSSLSTSSSEAIAGSGTVSLHKVSKTGKLGDLNERTIEKLNEPDYYGNTPTVTTMARVDKLRANRFAGGLHPTSIICETSTDAGATWQSAGLSDNAKLWLMTNAGGNLAIPLKNGVKSTDCMARITLSGIEFNDTVKALSETARFAQMTPENWYNNRVYASISDLYFWLSSNSDRIAINVYASRGNDKDNWTLAGSNPAAAGWSGMNTIHLNGNYSFGGGSTQTGNYWFIRITFRTCATDGSFDDSKLSTSSTTSQQGIYNIMGYGANCWGFAHPMGGIDRPYTYSGNNGTYLHEVFKWNGDLVPSTGNTFAFGTTGNQWEIVCGRTLYENGTSLANKYLGKTAKAADSDKLDGNDSSYFYPASNPNGYTSNTGTITGVSINNNSIATSGVANIQVATVTAPYGSDNPLTTVSFVNDAISNLNAVKYVSQSLTDAQKTQARTNIGAGTSNFTGYTSSNKLSTDYINNVAGWTSNTGTVTSVSAGTGLSISGTASTTPTVNIASGYKLPTTTEWGSVVTGPSSAVSGRIAAFDGTTGKVIADNGGITISHSGSASSLISDTITFTGGSIQTITESSGSEMHLGNVTAGYLAIKPYVSSGNFYLDVYGYADGVPAQSNLGTSSCPWGSIYAKDISADSSIGISTTGTTTGNLYFNTSDGGGYFYKDGITMHLGHTGYTSYSLTFPTTTGTLALTSQIPSTSSFVNLTGSQSISGTKTFTGNNLTISYASGAPAMKFQGSSSGWAGTTILQAGTPGGSTRTITLPSTDGTLALTSFVSANPSSTTASLTGITINGTGYAIEGGSVNIIDLRS